ncbi:restriction endonuclease subunit S [Micromonospora antibiotica]|uniref:Restriction endonuclease subunit S n=1 Tax=Micromonospora antibiotica TaxID=2807623 RepID=A0ABS3VIK0_9ACTN|nr:restriction endonuclease subunit S [Micromonospora antibiotica]MBO4165412.1 restriction endonuclease subunit S [Micromonospora antibiotica]
MTDLPPGWEWSTLGDLVTRIEAGKSFTCHPRPARDDEWGVLKVSAMTWGEFREQENKAVPEGREFDPRYEVRPGDILVSRANTEQYVGAPVLVRECRPRLLLSDKSLRLVPSSEIDSAWLLRVLSSSSIRRQISARASGQQDSMRNISQQALLSLDLPLPPLAEQRRIVAAVDIHFSRLDAASHLLTKQLLRLRALKKRLLVDSVPVGGETGWRTVTVAEAGRVDLGRQRHPDWHTGDHMRPYLRVANVFEDRIDTTDVMEMDFPPAVFEKFKLMPGDILLNEGQSPELLGRPALYRGFPGDVAFTNSLLRFRAGPDVDPEWALLVFRRHMHAGRFSREVRITTNIAHLSATRFKAVEFPIPPLTEQREIVARTADRLAGVERLIAEVEHAARNADALRASLLAEAFAGRLVPQDPNDEPASDLLARIRVERSTAIPKQRTRARRTPKELAAPPTRVTGDDYQQETLPL